MGTHIDAFFPHCIELSPVVVQEWLAALFGGLQDDLATIRERGRFSPGAGDWWIVADGDTLYGEGSSGFSIRVYSAVIEFTSVERFGALEYPDWGTHVALRRVFEVVAAGFGGGGRLAVAAGGFGDTDRAGDVAFNGGEFADVCRCLEAVIGAPARSWEALEAGSGAWYLSDVASSSDIA
jgi:hypothetical protein